jgi:hypothetical protein
LSLLRVLVVVAMLMVLAPWVRLLHAERLLAKAEGARRGEGYVSPTLEAKKKGRRSAQTKRGRLVRPLSNTRVDVPGQMLKNSRCAGERSTLSWRTTQ